MNKKLITLLTIVSLGFISVFGQAGRYTNLFSESELRAHVKFLSDDLFEGRGPGTRGGELAEKYIAAQLEMAGIKGAGKNDVRDRIGAEHRVHQARQRLAPIGVAVVGNALNEGRSAIAYPDHGNSYLSIAHPIQALGPASSARLRLARRFGSI